jgi:hypothetical protein
MYIKSICGYSYRRREEERKSERERERERFLNNDTTGDDDA